MAGVKPSEILASHILVQFCVMLVQTAITLSFILYVFSVPCHGPLLWLALLTVLQGLAGMSFGFLISAAVDTQVTSAKSTLWSPKIFLSSSKNIFGPQKIFCNHKLNSLTGQAVAMQLSIGSFYPCLLLSGILWPLEGMPAWLQTVASLLPNTLACQVSWGWSEY